MPTTEHPKIFDTKFLTCIHSGIPVAAVTGGEITSLPPDLFPNGIKDGERSGVKNRSMPSVPACLYELNRRATIREILDDMDSYMYSPYWFHQDQIVEYIKAHPEHLFVGGTIFPYLPELTQNTGTRRMVVMVEGRFPHLSVEVSSIEKGSYLLPPGPRFVIREPENV